MTLQRTTPTDTPAYFVNPSFGNDANPGTMAAPFKTLPQADMAASVNDVIVYFGKPVLHWIKTA